MNGGRALLPQAAWLRPASRNRQIGIGGVLLAALGVWLMLPPLGEDLRAHIDAVEIIPAVLGTLAVAAGIWTLARGERRWGWGAILAGVLGIVLGVAAARGSMTPPRGRVRVVEPHRGDPQVGDAADLRRDGWALFRAQRRREHRARGDDADGRVLRGLGVGRSSATGPSGC